MENTDSIFNLGSDLSVVVAKVDKNEQDSVISDQST
jgi:PII-like signaling protein